MAGALFLLLAVVWGMILGPPVRFFRRLAQRLRSRWAVVLLTVAAATLLLAATALFLLRWSNGALSFYTCLAMLGGYLLYTRWLRPPLSPLGSKLSHGAARAVRLPERTARGLLRLALLPTGAAVRWLEKLFAAVPRPRQEPETGETISEEEAV